MHVCLCSRTRFCPGAVLFCPAAPAKRPMTFEDMMKMKRLGDTAVSPDGKWLAYAVTTVDLDQNTKTTELWVQAIAARLRVYGPDEAGRGRAGRLGNSVCGGWASVLFLSGRDGSQQVWLADFDGATGTASNAKKLTAFLPEPIVRFGRRTATPWFLFRHVYPDCPAITPADGGVGDKCNADRDAALAGSKVKAKIFTHLLYRHWDHYTGDKRSPSLSAFG